MGIKLIKKTNEAAYTAIKNPGQAAFLIDCGSPEKAKELNDAFYEVAFLKNGWEPNKEVIGGELIQGWNVGQFFTAAVDPCDKAAKWCEEWLRNSDGKAPGIQGNSAGLESKKNEDKAYTFTWWDNEPTSSRRPTTSDDLKNCLHEETFNAADDPEALRLAMEYLCDYIGEDPENVADTPEEVWDYFDGDWGYGDPIPMVLKQGSRVVKDSGFNPEASEDDDWERRKRGNEKLSPKMQKRLKLKAWQVNSMKMKGFEEAGYSFLDLYDDGKCSAFITPTKGYETEKEALAAAKKIFDDFDKYLEITALFDEGGGPDGEPVWFPAYGLKKTFMDVPEGEGLKVLSELSDVLYRLYTREIA